MNLTAFGRGSSRRCCCGSAPTFSSAHAWLTWDSWLIPWFLCTALLASLDWWFAAGLAMGLGAMFKGQELFVAVIFIVWPLMLGRPGAALRWICGLGLMISLIASGWLLTYVPPAQLAAARGVQETLAVADYPPGLFAIRRAFDYGAATWIFELLLFTAAVPWLACALCACGNTASADAAENGFKFAMDVDRRRGGADLPRRVLAIFHAI